MYKYPPFVVNIPTLFVSEENDVNFACFGLVLSILDLLRMSRLKFFCYYKWACQVRSGMFAMLILERRKEGVMSPSKTKSLVDSSSQFIPMRRKDA